MRKRRQATRLQKGWEPEYVRACGLPYKTLIAAKNLKRMIRVLSSTFIAVLDVNWVMIAKTVGIHICELVHVCWSIDNSPKS